tara:strand:- start:140 stop:925 length:786 start_codon:yes stop_codon:yes gene_type:complete
MSTPSELNIQNVMNGNPSKEWILENLHAIHEMSTKRKRIEVPAISLMKPATLHNSRQSRKRNKMTQSELRKCINCNEILSNHEHSCRNCAVVQEVDWLEMPTLNEMKYKLMTHSMPCAYKRINHFNEKLAQFQGKEKTIIPDCVFDAIRDEIVKNKNLDIETLTPRDVKYVLKKLNLSKFYEHVNFITNKLNGFDLPILSPQEEDRLRNMFNLIQTPFSQHSPPWRKNFLNYASLFYFIVTTFFEMHKTFVAYIFFTTQCP